MIDRSPEPVAARGASAGSQPLEGRVSAPIRSRHPRNAPRAFEPFVAQEYARARFASQCRRSRDRLALPN